MLEFDVNHPQQVHLLDIWSQAGGSLGSLWDGLHMEPSQQRWDYGGWID